MGRCVWLRLQSRSASAVDDGVDDSAHAQSNGHSNRLSNARLSGHGDPMTRLLVLALMLVPAMAVTLVSQQAASGQTQQEPDVNAYYQLGPDSLSARRRAQRRNPRPVYAAQPGLSGHAAHLLGLRARAVRPLDSGEPHDLSGRPGVQGHGRRLRAHRMCSTT